MPLQLLFEKIEDMLTKMSSFSHTGLNKEEFRDRTRIVDRVRKGMDLWDREGEIIFELKAMRIYQSS